MVRLKGHETSSRRVAGSNPRRASVGNKKIEIMEGDVCVKDVGEGWVVGLERDKNFSSFFFQVCPH